jgi:hypothetical protein
VTTGDLSEWWVWTLSQAAAKAAKKSKGVVLGAGVAEVRDWANAATGETLELEQMVRRLGHELWGREDGIVRPLREDE